jgi:hypothetical protein
MAFLAAFDLVTRLAGRNTVVIGISTTLPQRPRVIHVGGVSDAHVVAELALVAVAVENPCPPCFMRSGAGAFSVAALPLMCGCVCRAVSRGSTHQLRTPNRIAGTWRSRTHGRPNRSMAAPMASYSACASGVSSSIGGSPSACSARVMAASNSAMVSRLAPCGMTHFHEYGWRFPRFATVTILSSRN